MGPGRACWRATSEVRQRVRTLSIEVSGEPQLASRDEVMAPLAYPRPQRLPRPTTPPRPPDPRPLTLAQAINQTLGEELADHDDVLVFGEDVAVKGGVYGVTRGLRERFGSYAGLRHPPRRADRARHRARHQPRGVRAGARDPVPRLPAQRRGPAPRARPRRCGSSPTASTPTAWSSGSRGWPTRRGSAATSTTTTRSRCCATSRGSRWPSPATRTARPALLRGCLDLAREGRVCVFVEPIARYHTRDLFEGDEGWLAPFDGSTRAALGDVVGYGTGRDLLAGDVRQRRLHEPPGGRGAAGRRLRLHGPRPRVGGAAAGRGPRRGGVARLRRPRGGRDPAQRRRLRGRGHSTRGRRGRGAGVAGDQRGLVHPAGTGGGRRTPPGGGDPGRPARRALRL